MSKKKVSANEYSKIRGVSPEAVKKAIRVGRISPSSYVKNSRGIYEIDVEKANKDWADNTISSEDKNEIDGISFDEMFDDDSVRLTFVMAKTMKENFKARQAQLEYEVMKGTLVSVEKVKQDSYAISRAIRNQLLTMPDRIAPELAHMKSAHEINLRLKKEITKCLEALINDDIE